MCPNVAKALIRVRKKAANHNACSPGIITELVHRQSRHSCSLIMNGCILSEVSSRSDNLLEGQNENPQKIKPQHLEDTLT